MNQDSQKKLDEVYKLIEEPESLSELSKEQKKAQIATLTSELTPPEIASLLESIEEKAARSLFKTFPDETAAEIIKAVNQHIREELLDKIDDQRLVKIINYMASDEVADVLSQLPKERVDRTLASLEEGFSAQIRQLLKYEDTTAGGLMATELVKVQQDVSVKEAIDELREVGPQMGKIDYLYVVDQNQTLVGVLSLKRLIVAKSWQKLSEIMNPDVVSVTQETDQIEVINTFRDYNLTALPVVDDGGRLIGKITADDVVRVVEEEASEEISKMAGTDQEEIIEDSPFKIARMRLPWTVVGLSGGIVSARLLSSFQETLGELLALAFFIPVIIALGGDIGLQSTSTTVRSIAIGEINPFKTWIRVLREVKTGLIMGVICGSIIGAVILTWQEDLTLSIVVGMAVLTTMTLSATLGTVLPLIFNKFGIDPAIATGPFITMTIDIMGIFIYFAMAGVVLKLFT